MIPFQLHRKIPLIRRPFYQRDQLQAKLGALTNELEATKKELHEARLQLAHPIPQGFFDQHHVFLSSSHTGALPNRLNQRYRACIEWNEAVIRGKRILDLASHDGRWSYAAIKAGAAKVVGIEARDYLVQAAVSNLRHYGVPENSFHFVSGDVFECIDKIDPNSVDTVFCFGYFYHIVNHMLLLSKIARLKPKNLIVDTWLCQHAESVIVVHLEDPQAEQNAARFDTDGSKPVVVGAPSKSAL